MKPLYVWMLLGGILLMAACSKDEDAPVLRQQQYELKAWGGSGISGTAYLSENLDSSFNITVVLNKTVKDTVHIMSVYNGTETVQGNIAFKLSDIRGTGGSAAGETRNIGQFIQESGSTKTLSYDDVIRYQAFIKVYYSNNRPDSLICQGRIGL
jgi:hypothetical protein